MKNWLKNRIITKEIDGEEVRFRRVPVGTLQKFRFLADDLSKTLTLVFKNTDNDVKTENVTTPSDKTDPEGVPYMSSSYTKEAAVPANISLRATQLENGIKGLVNAVLSEESLEVLCEVIKKSAWEEDWPENAKDMADGLPMDIMFEFLKGAFEASAGDYTELGKSLFRKIPNLQDSLGSLAEVQEGK